MNATDIISIFGAASDDDRAKDLFRELNTLRRPQRPDASDFEFYEWVLVRRRGVELGFVDEEFLLANDQFRWGHGKLILSQVYFYSARDDIQTFSGRLPFDLDFSDTRQEVRHKLSAYESTRHSFISDTWDLDGYRMCVTYKENEAAGIECVFCFLNEKPFPQKQGLIYPSIERIHQAFGCSVRDPEFNHLWSNILKKEDYLSAKADGEIELYETYGAALRFSKSKDGPLFRSISFRRNRDRTSVGWGGALPKGLDFEDSPEILFSKISSPPVKQDSIKLTGYAVWHFEEYTLHVLYSNIYNRLLRIGMIAPGLWKSAVDAWNKKLDL